MIDIAYKNDEDIRDMIDTVKSWNKKLITGFNILQNLSIRLKLLAIFINPLHKHIVPKRVNVICTVLSVDSNIELFNSSKFPEKIAYIIDTIINIGQILFNIFIPH